MKIGIHCDLKCPEEWIYPLLVLSSGLPADAKFNLDFESRKPLGVIIETNDDIYKFSDNYNDFDNYDKKIKLITFLPDFNIEQDKNLYDFCISSVLDNLREEENDTIVLNFLNNGNYIFCSGTSNIKHENMIVNPYFILKYYYYIHGYFYINYYQTLTKKQNLLGIYHRRIHIAASPHERRNFIFDKVKKLLNDDFVCYTNHTSKFSQLVDKSKWHLNSISNYTDFSSSVCNIIFETFDSVGTWVDNNRVVISEKTLKGILYSKELIFFIWYGNITGYKFLKDNGFWFLNFEFMNETLPEQNNNFFNDRIETSLGNSVYQTALYLKKLKLELKTNDAVYDFLLNKYKDKLENNFEIFKKVDQDHPDFIKLIGIFKNEKNR